MRLETPSCCPGIMHDDGLNGDQTASDGKFSLQISVNEPVAGQFGLRVSAAFQGSSGGISLR